jgi:DNA-binding response OmpR family regulator
MPNPCALVVEDDQDVAELYRRVLESVGFSAEVIRTGEGALARLAAVAPAVVLLDLNLLSRVSGSDILHQIRADERLTGTRVVMVTGHREVDKTIRDAADAVLYKPVDIGELSDVIARLRPR